MILGSDVQAALLAKANGRDDFYEAKLDGEEDIRAYAVGPFMSQGTIRGRVVALFNDCGERRCLIAPYGMALYKPDVTAAFPNASGIICLYEKSCGAVVFLGEGSQRRYLLIENRRHNWGFPKGHVEAGEDERATAAREIFEETGLTPTFIDGFRQSVSYHVKEQIHKTAVYFIAKAASADVRIPSGEISSYKLLPYTDTVAQLTYRSEQALLTRAEAFLNAQGL